MITQTTYHRTTINNAGIFYRKAGNPKNPAIVLLHGFPTSSHQYRNLIPELAEQYYVIAPDYPGFGHSDAPDHKTYAYTFDNFAKIVETLLTELNVKQFAIYVFDYGAPVGFRLYQANPDRITAIITQNGNAYEDGLGEFWTPLKDYWETGASAEREALRGFTGIEGTKWQYENGVPADRLQLLSPDSWQHDQSLMDRPGNADIQLDLFYNYRTNLPLYPKWQEIFRRRQTPLLAVWGKNDKIFVPLGGEAYKRDLKNAEIHMLDTGHFVLETHLQETANLIKAFLEKHLTSTKKAA